ncbi:MAG: HAD family hydrolase [Arachnia sp.]
MDAAAVIFDLDGTLIDSEEVWDLVRRELATDAQIAWDESWTRAMMGMSTQEWSAHLADVVGIPMPAPEVAQATIEKMVEHHRRGVAVLPGAVAAVHRMAQLSPVAINSSSPRVLIEAAVSALGLQGVFAATVSTEEVGLGKPDPAGYLRAAELLKVDPGRCVVVEDSANGIRSAQAAGMAVVSIPPRFQAPGQELLTDVCVISSLNELTAGLIAGL